MNDNMMYLSTLSKALEPMYYHTPEEVKKSLPGLLKSLSIMHDVAKYYGSRDRMTVFLRKVTNQIIKNCIDSITSKGKFWNQNRAELIQQLQVRASLSQLHLDDGNCRQICCSVCASYEEQYQILKDEQQAHSQKPFEFDEHTIFLRLRLFSKRMKKLCSMLTTVDQFSNLSMQTHIDGLEEIVKNFDGVVDDIRRKPYDLLDFSNTQFDRDYMEFNVNIHELEIEIQV